jgi:hypothetical protein
VKTKNTLPEKRKNTQVQAASRAAQPEPLYKDLHLIEQILPFLGQGEAPSAIDCENLNLIAYLTADALAQFIDLADIGLRHENSAFYEGDSPTRWVVQALQFNLQLARLTSKTLFRLRQEPEAAAQSPNAA